MDSFFELWVKDKQSIIALMKRNMQSDIDAGYDRCSSSIVRQTVEIGYYEKRFDNELKQLRTMTEKQAEHWCKVDMIRRGAIEVSVQV